MSATEPARARPLRRLAVGLVLLAAAGPVTVPAAELFTFQGDDVYESSGLVDRGDVVYTVNDSGDDAVVYGIDPRTGRTRSRTTYAEGVEDVEGLAPGSRGTVWVGDIGDNRQRREVVSVYRVQPGGGSRSGIRYDLSYPDGAHDAETLLVRPGTERVLVVTKSVFGGRVYLAPRDLRPSPARNRLRPVARVSGLVTDGAFLPDGDHVVLRTYRTATGYTYPGFAPLGTVDLPDQRQGEALAVSGTGRVLVSTEGVATAVLRVRLPGSLAGVAPDPSRGPSAGASSGPSAGAPSEATTGAAPAGTGAGTGDRPASAASPASPASPEAAGRGGRPRSTGDWVGIGLVSLAVAGIGWLTLRAATGPADRPR